MAITQEICNSFKQQLFNGEHDLDTGSAFTYRIALYTSTATLNKSTTTYSATNEVVGTGYTAGGNALTLNGTSLTGDIAYLDFADTEWTSASFTAAGALIYKDDTVDQAVCVLSFGGDQTVSSGTFTIQFPTADSSNAILRIT